jgi:hypothetical protein
MRYGFYLPTRGGCATADALEAIVQRGEALSFHSVMIADHVMFPTVIDSKYPYTVSASSRAAGMRWTSSRSWRSWPGGPARSRSSQRTRFRLPAPPHAAEVDPTPAPRMQLHRNLLPDPDEARTLLASGLGLRACARQLGVHPSAIARAVANPSAGVPAIAASFVGSAVAVEAVEKDRSSGTQPLVLPPADSAPEVLDSEPKVTPPL